MRGMASATEAEQLLGLSRLRKVSALVRPDVYGNRAAGHSAPGERDPLTIAVGQTSERPSPWQMLGRAPGETR